MKRVEDMLTDEEEQALREDLRCIHRSVYPEWDRTPRAGSSAARADENSNNPPISGRRADV